MASVKVIVHRLAGVTFVVALGVAFVGGLIWALTPEESTGFTITGGELATPVPAPTPTGETPAAEPTPSPTPTPTPTPTIDVEALIAAARQPSDTTMQVLEAGAGMTTTQEAAAYLRDELGYNVVNVTSARANVDRTTVWFTQGNADEARALQAREPRVAVVESNRGLNEVTDLHVLVGPNWDADDEDDEDEDD